MNKFCIQMTNPGHGYHPTLINITSWPDKGEATL
jgi:hypothetical protein